MDRPVSTILRQDLPLIAGLAALWPCFHSSPLFPLSVVPLNWSASTLFSLEHLVYALIVVAGMALFAAVKGRFTAPVERGITIALGIMSCASLALLGYSTVSPLNGGFLPYLVLFFIALGTTWFALSLLERLVRFSGREICLALGLSYILYSIIWLIAELAMAPARAALFALCPAICAVSLLLDGNAVAANDLTDAPPKPLSAKEIRAALPVPFIVMGCLFVYFGVLSVRIFTAMSLGDITVGNLSAFSYAATAMTGLVLTVLFMLLVDRRGTGEVTMLTVMVMLALLYLAVLLLITMNFSATFTMYSKRVMVAVEHCFEMLLIAIIVASVAEKKLPAAPVLAASAIIVLVLPQLIAQDILVLTGALGVLTAYDAVEIIAAVAMFLIAVALVIMLLRAMRATSERAQKETPVNPEDWQRELCRRALAGAEATDRELDVVLLTYRGLSAKKAAEELLVSESTVKAHLQHVYNKLDIHTKQDLIAYIDSFK